MDIFAQNKKIKNSSNSQYLVINFGIPAYQSNTGLITCPMAGECKKGCYARQGAYVWANVSPAFERRLALTLDPNWTPIQAELDRWKTKATKQGKQLVVRWHDSGDFYNITYIIKALEFFAKNNTVIFYAYTKMIPVFKELTKQGRIPENFTLIYSFGGIADNLIDVNIDRHSAVFSSLDLLVAAGYEDTTENDLVAALGASNKIGLVYHGAKGKAWTKTAA